MDIDTNITIGFSDKYVGITPLEINYDKSWGTTFNILKFHFASDASILEITFAVFSYNNTQYLQQLEILGLNLITKHKPTYHELSNKRTN